MGIGSISGDEFVLVIVILYSVPVGVEGVGVGGRGVVNFV